MHQCLRDHMDQLTEGCRQEELKLNIIQSRDIRLRPKLNKLCSEEIAIFCKEVQPGEASLPYRSSHTEQCEKISGCVFISCLDTPCDCCAGCQMQLRI